MGSGSLLLTTKKFLLSFRRWEKKKVSKAPAWAWPLLKKSLTAKIKRFAWNQLQVKDPFSPLPGQKINSMKPIHLLLVEDDPLDIIDIGRSLEKAGILYRLTIKKNGEDA